jgi:TPP-dependent pyruvate/acetoin dehydrogenase alpha subunit
MYDAELYRSKDEVEQWKKRDPIALFVARLWETKLLEANLKAMEVSVAAEVAEVVAFAEAGRWTSSTS